MKNLMHYYYIFFMITALMTSCKSEYANLVEHELSSGIRFDSLPLEMKVGMTKSEFFEHCWQLNKEQKISQGPGNKYAKYVMNPDTIQDQPKTIEVLFYGIFDKSEVMYGLEMKMSYTAWSPWNKEYSSGKLVEHIKRKYMKTYGSNSFIPIKINDEIDAFVKVDGNRQIRVYPLNFKDIMVKFEDLEHLRNSKS